jgi:hypothetical protein
MGVLFVVGGHPFVDDLTGFGDGANADSRQKVLKFNELLQSLTATKQQIYTVSINKMERHVGDLDET